MSNFNQYIKYLNESKDDLEDKIIQTSAFIYKNGILNIVYEIYQDQDQPFTHIIHIGAPVRFIDTLNHSVSAPIKLIQIDLKQTSELNKVFIEKKPIYFRNIQNLIIHLLPAIKQDYQAQELLTQYGLSELAVLNFEITKYKKEYLIACLGPLNDEQKLFIKNVIFELTNYYNSVSITNIAPEIKQKKKKFFR